VNEPFIDPVSCAKFPSAALTSARDRTMASVTAVPVAIADSVLASEICAAVGVLAFGAGAVVSR